MTAMHRVLARGVGALIVIAAVAASALLYFAHEVFIPVALALLLSVLLSTAVEALHHRGFPRAASAVLILMIFVVAVGAAADVIIEPAQQWLDSAPRTVLIIEKKVRPLEILIQRLESLPGLAEPAGTEARTVVEMPARASAAAAILGSGVVAATGATLAKLLAVIVLTLFLLSGGPPMLARMAASVSTELHAAKALRIIEAIRVEVGRYYGTVALLNLGLCISTALGMWWLRMPNPVLWGVVAGILNFIPYVGSAMTLLLLAIVALVSFDSLSHVFVVAGFYLALAMVGGQILHPWLVGRRLDLNPILVFLAIWFGGFLWGLAGIMIAVPSLVSLKVAAAHSSSAQPLIAFLSPTGSQTLSSLKGKVSAAGARLKTSSRSRRRLD